MISLDIRTLVLLSSLIALILAMIMLVVYRTRKTYDGFSCWVWFAFCSLAAMLLTSFRHLVPEMVSVVAANTSLALAYGMVVRGVYLYFGRRLSEVLFWIPLILVMVAFPVFTFFYPSVSSRIVIISIVVAYYAVLSARCCRAHRLNNPSSSTVMVCGPLWVLAIYCGIRIFYTALFEMGIEDLMSASLFQAISIIVLTGSHVALTIGLILMTSLRLEQELRDANAAIRTLEGILPICMHCKEIRDDQGYWNTLETYISSRTEAQFSHSICESCLEKLYPENEEQE